MAKSIAFTFGRFNPPTIGHEKLLDATLKVNKHHRIYASHSQDRKKNPLEYREKLKYMKEMFPSHKSHIVNSSARTAIEVLVSLYEEEYTDIAMVVGSDRVGEFDKLLKTYNGVKGKHGFYKFDTIRIVSAGERDPDAEGATGMSASKMRQAASDNNYETFKQGLPKSYDGKKLFSDVRKGMGIKSFKEWNIEESSEIEESDSIETIMAKIASNTIWKKEYEAAKKMYLHFIKRGQSSGTSLTKAAGVFRHVNPRALRIYIDN